jgi:hypothetical protein
LAFAIIDHVKQIADLVQKYQDMELYQSIVNLKGEIIDLQEQLLALRQELAASKAEIKNLDDQLQLKGKLERIGLFYYLEGDDAGYCARCWEIDRKLSHIATIMFKDQGLRQGCPQCKTAYHGSPRRGAIKQE